MAKVVVIGSFNVDLVTYVENLPRAGETIAGHDFTTGPGGKGSNQAVAAAQLNADVTFIGRVGVDQFADMGFRIWDKVGINSDYVIRDPETPTGTATIFVEQSGENVIVIAGGANLALSKEDIDAAETAIAEADVLLTQFEIELDVARYALSLAQKHDVKTILNPAPARVAPIELIRHADVITPNTTELEVLRESTKLPVSQVQTLVVTHGARGVHWMHGKTDSMVPAFPVDVVDSVGAGDAFNASLAVALAEGKEMVEALRFASAAAALSVTKRGAAESMPNRDEVENFLQKHSG